MLGVKKVQPADETSIATEAASVCQKVAVCERMKVLSLLEMAVWRLKVRGEKVTCASCRVNCGSNIVLINVMTFMDRATP